MRVDRLLHLHRLEDDDEIAALHGHALFDRALDDGRLHRRRDGLTGRPGDARPLRPARRGAARHILIDEREEGGGHRHFDAATPDLHDDVLTLALLADGRNLALPCRNVVRELALDPHGVDPELAVRRRERGVANDLAVEREHGRETVDLELVERATRPFECLLTGRAGDDEFAEHRVKGARDDVARAHTRVDAHPRPRGRAEECHGAGRRKEAASRILSVDAELERVTLRDRIVVVEHAALGDAELLTDKIDSRDLLGNRMLDLQSRVDLEERHGAVACDEELAGARPDVPDLPHDRLRGAVQFGVLCIGEEGRGCLFHELLVSALQRAITGRNDDDVAVLVREALRFDVTGLLQVLLDEALAAAERRDGLARC